MAQVSLKMCGDLNMVNWFSINRAKAANLKKKLNIYDMKVINYA